VGLIFAPDHEQAAAELARLVRPDGRLGLTAWTPESGIARGMRVAARFQPPPPEGAGNPFEWAVEDHVSALLGDWFALEFHQGNAPQTGESGEALWDYFLAGVGPTRLLYDSLDPERREEYHRASVELYEQDRRGDEIYQERPYLLTLGRRR
jgi:SAM-dependent methyltransferase